MRIDEALILYDQRQYAKAAHELRLALALAPRDGFAHAMLALCLCTQRNWPAAREHASQAIELAPGLGICFYAWARVQASQIHYLDVPLIGRRWNNPAAVAQVYAAIQKAIEDPAVVKKMQDLGLQTSYLNGADYKTFWAGQEEDFKDVLPLVQKKD